MITVKNISFSYPKTTHVVIHDLSFELAKGDVCGLIGESGSGKSTLLRMICGLERPCSGEVTIADQLMSDMHFFLPPEKRAVGMVLQDYGLFPHLTVEQNIRFGLHKLKRKEQEVIVDEMLALVSMEAFRGRYPYQLSGGQQQRVALARSLAPKPQVLLLDEPFSNLDAHLKADIRQELKEILQTLQMTCILSSHDIADIDVVCNKRLTLLDGDVSLT